jgi:uncharacterized protein
MNTTPPYAFVPGGPWPHPRRDPTGHSFGHPTERPPAIEEDAWNQSECYLRGVALFNAGYYWEAHEVWEALWHAHHRHGPIADLLKALIKLAAAGVKVRERQPGGVVTHAGRAFLAIDAIREQVGDRLLGLDLARLSTFAKSIRDQPPTDPGPRDSAVTRLFEDALTPS